MNNKKVAEKVIWEDSISPDNEASLASSQPQMQTQPQMTFCYKCNNVIPGNSKYCPYCQTELYVVCPKCGEKYSSQYPSCSQCGTNRKEYLELQRREQERKIAAERERQRYQEKLERERQAKEYQERLRTYEQKEKEKQEKEKYKIENEEIKKTKEYELVRVIINESLELYYKNMKKKQWFYSILMIVILLFSLFSGEIFPAKIYNKINFLFMWSALLVIPMYGIIMEYVTNDKKKEQFLLQNLSRNEFYNKDIIIHDFIKMVNYQGWERWSDCFIITYRKVKGLPVKHEWHSLC